MPDPTRRSVAGITVRCAVGDIAAQAGFDAVVNAANVELRTGGGVAGALHRAAGPGLAETGAFAYPLEAAARVAIEDVVARAPELEFVRGTRLVLYDEHPCQVHVEALAAVLEERG